MMTMIIVMITMILITLITGGVGRIKCLENASKTRISLSPGGDLINITIWHHQSSSSPQSSSKASSSKASSSKASSSKESPQLQSPKMEDNSSGSPLQRMASITNALVSQPSQVHSSSWSSWSWGRWWRCWWWGWRWWCCQNVQLDPWIFGTKIQ